ncbi:MAG TPA: hypothetical protein VJ761_23120 [Ktedonobacteraceae bacterium]|nr:hypothetical protein [Ktedonobacteraceae bacterium]
MNNTATDHTLWEVPLKSGRVVRGTAQELNARFPHANWKRVARPVRAPYDAEVEQDGAEDPRPGRLRSSSVNYLTRSGQRIRVEDRSQTVIPRRAHAVSTTEDIPQATAKPTRRRRGRHPLWYLGLGMVGMLLVWQGLSLLGNWWQQHQLYATYGYPPIYQTDAMVGHNGDSHANPSHFLFLNLHGHPEVIEVPAGDETKQHTYLLPELVTDGYDTIPVTGAFVDVNGDGKLDLIVHIQDQRLVLLNTGTGFRPLKPGEHITLPANEGSNPP